MDTLRLRVKYIDGERSLEFEAEGPLERVIEQSQEWRKLLDTTVRYPALPERPPKRVIDAKPDDRAKLLFAADEDLIILNAMPKGENQFWHAVLLVLYGYKVMANTDDVMVTKIRGSLKRSGLPVQNVGRAAAPYIGTLVLKTGVRIGSRYRLTTRGLTEAKALAEKLIAEMS